MITSPDSTVRIAPGDSLTLEGQEPAQVRLVPRFGEGRALALEGGGFAFPSIEAPDSVTLEWLDSEGTRVATSYALVVSQHYFSLGDLRGYGDGQDDFSDLPEETLWNARQAATEVFEENANRSFVQRIGRTKDYRGRPLLELRHNDVYELLTDGYRLVSDCQVEPTAPKALPVWVEYLYGLDSIPMQVSRAVLELAAYMIRPTNRPIGATGESTDAGYIHFTTAGRDGATDIPEVNAAIEQYGRRRYMW